MCAVLQQVADPLLQLTMPRAFLQTPLVHPRGR
jgi:hypothetical protein